MWETSIECDCSRPGLLVTAEVGLDGGAVGSERATGYAIEKGGCRHPLWFVVPSGA